MNYTKKEYDLLLRLRRKPQPAARLYKRLKPKNDWQWNVWLSDLSGLYYVEPENAKVLDREGVIVLNDLGQTVVQDEYDRQSGMRRTRRISIISIAISVFTLLLEAAAKLWPLMRSALEALQNQP